jgi:hypothetical protein
MRASLTAPILLGLLSGALLGCGSSSSPKTQAAAHPREGRPCQASDLSVKPRWGIALGSSGGTWRLTKTSAGSCKLDKRLRADVIGPNGALVVKGEPNTTSGPKSVELHSGEAALFEVLWGNWCGPRAGTFRVELVLPGGGGTLSTRAPAPATCTRPSPTPSTISVSGVRLEGSTKSS